VNNLYDDKIVISTIVVGLDKLYLFIVKQIKYSEFQSSIIELLFLS